MAMAGRRGTGHNVRMDILLNGQPLTLDTASTITGLLQSQALAGRRVAVEVNGQIVPRSQHETHALADGDQVEIVHAMGGG